MTRHFSQQKGFSCCPFYIESCHILKWPSPLQTQALTLIYAYGTTDEIGYHGVKRGAKELNLLNHVTRATVTNSNYLTATMDNVGIMETKI